MASELIQKRPGVPPAATVLRDPPALIAAKDQSAKKAFRGFFLARYPNPKVVPAKFLLISRSHRVRACSRVHIGCQARR